MKHTHVKFDYSYQAALRPCEETMQCRLLQCRNVVDRPRAVAQLHCPETLLPSLVQASRQQGFGWSLKHIQDGHDNLLEIMTLTGH